MYDYSYTDYSYTDVDTASSILGGLIAGFGVLMIISFILIIIGLISQWKIYKKAGKGGWECLIPIYNIIVLLQIVELPMWYIALFFVPLANIYAMFKIYIELAHKFGKSTGFGVATVFFNFICLPILAFSKNCVYQGGSNMNNIEQNNNFTPTPNQSMNDNVMNINNQSVQQPISFDQNVNTDLNPINPVQNNDINVLNQVNSMPQSTEPESVVFNAVPTQPVTAMQPENNVQPAVNTQPQGLNVIPNMEPVTEPVQDNSMVNNSVLPEPSPQESVTFNPIPQPVQPVSLNPTQTPQVTPVQPENNVQAQGLNVIPNMGPTITPEMQNQNPVNNQNNTNM